MGRCTICLEAVPITHWHHVIPRSRGGENGPQIELCPGDHNTLHANALAIIRRMKGGNKKPLRQFWSDVEAEKRAQQYLEVLVRAMMSPPVCEREHLLSASVSTTAFEEFKILQQDLGLSSHEKTVEYCIQFTLNNKGLKNVLSKGVQTKDQLWFLPVPR